MYTRTKTQRVFTSKTAELLIYSQKFSKTYADTYIFEPANSDEEALGKLFIVVEIEHHKRSAKEVTDAIAAIMQNEYYRQNSETIEEHFEHAVQKTNEILGDLAEQGETSWVGKIHSIVAILHNDSLFITKAGNASTLLIRGSQAIDITDGLSEDHEKDNPLMTFTNIASGKVEPRDKILFATPVLFKNIEFESIFKTLLKYSPSTATTRLQALLQTKRLQCAVGALVSEIHKQSVEDKINHAITSEKTAKQEKADTQSQKETSPKPLEKDKIDQPLHTQEPETHLPPKKTESVEKETSDTYQQFDSPLSEPDPVETQDNLTGETFRELLDKEKMDDPGDHVIDDLNDQQVLKNGFQENPSSSSSPRLEKTNANKKKGVAQIPFIILHFFKQIGTYGKKLFYNISNRNKQHKYLSDPQPTSFSKIEDKDDSGDSLSIKDPLTEGMRLSTPRRISGRGIGGFISRTLDRFRRLPRTSRLFFSAFIPIAILFVISTSFLFGKNKSKEENKNFNQIIVSAEDKYEEAETAMIYGDHEKALTLLKEADALQGEVSGSQDFKDRSEELRSNIQKQYDQINKVTRLDNIQPKVVLEKNGDTILASTIFGFGSHIYSFNHENNKIYDINLETGTKSDLTRGSKNIGHFQSGTYYEKKDELIFYTDTPSIAQYSLGSNEVENVQTTFAADNQDIRDITSYGSKIYLLDIANSQIYVHSSTTTGFGKGAKWLKNDASLADATSLAIDGRIYILKSNGTVLRYLSGNPEPFEISGLNDAMDNPVDIYTDIDSENIYIADPKNNRIIVLNKEGKLLQQFVSEEFGKATSVYFQTSRAGNRIVVLSDGKVFEINGPESYE